MKLLFLLLNVCSLFAQETMSYQGRLTQDNGAPLAGPVSLSFRVYEGGTLRCSKPAGAPIALSNGLFTVDLAFSSAECDGKTFSKVLADATGSLSIQVSDGTKTYTQNLSAVPVAIYALQSGSSTSVPKIKDTDFSAVSAHCTVGQVLKIKDANRSFICANDDNSGLGGGGTLTSVVANAPLHVATVGGDVTLSLSSTGTPGTYTKVTVDNYGRVVGSGALDVTDIVSGIFPLTRIPSLDLSRLPTIPAAKLQGVGGACLPGQFLTTDGTNINCESSSPFDLWTSGSGDVYRPSGKVGIGGIPSDTLDVYGDIHARAGKVYLSNTGGKKVSLSANTSQAVDLDFILPSSAGMAGQYLTLGTSGQWQWTDLPSTGGNWSSDGANVYTTSGNVGIGTSAPSFLFDIQDHTSTNTYAASIVRSGIDSAGLRVFDISNTHHSSSSSANKVIGQKIDFNPRVDSGVTESGTYASFWQASMRNYQGASLDDSGTVANFYGQYLQYGHHAQNVGASPQTTNFYGLYFSPNIQSGTITNFYDIYLGSAASGGTVTNRYAIYQAANIKNYFAGSIGIGTTSPSAKLDVAGEIRVEGSTQGYVGFKAASSTSSTTYTFPTTAGANGQFLTTDGNGILSWSTLTAPITSVNAKTGAINLNTDDILEGAANKYYSDAKVRSAPLTGLSSGTGSIVATDTILQAFGKLLSLPSDYVSKSGNNNVTGSFNLTGITSFMQIPTPTGVTPLEATNVQYVQNYVAANKQWGMNGSDLYYTAGKIGVGTNNPTTALHVTGTITSEAIVNGTSAEVVINSKNFVRPGEGAVSGADCSTEGTGSIARDSSGNLYVCSN